MLTEAQEETFWRDGCVTVANAASPEQIAAMRAAFDGWVEDSRTRAQSYGETMDGRARFDLEPTHSAERPALRRVASPQEIAPIYWEVLTRSAMADMMCDLLGPNLRFHHAKINSKLPQTDTVVKWHQDFAFDPHSNDDVLTALLFLDDVTEANGPLRTAPGTHRGPLYEHWQDGVFTGAMDAEASAAMERGAISNPGSAGSVCLMHARVAHASSANRSDDPRTLFIAVVAAADAAPLAPNPVPSKQMGALLRGEEPGRVRAIDFEMALPEFPKGASFFVQQAQQ